MPSSLILDLVSACEEAAIAAYQWYGRGDKIAADQAAVDAMRTSFNKINMDGLVVIGEGEMDEAPMLYIGEKLGSGTDPKVDIAVDPLEGTTILAEGRSGALAVCAVTDSGGFLQAPDMYMEKIAIGFDFKEQIISLSESVENNLKNIALAKKCRIDELIVTILDRARHKELIAKVRTTGARINLIGDGDIAGVIGTALGVSDVYMGSGGAPEGVLAAAGLHATGGQFSGRLVFENETQLAYAKKLGITAPEKIYSRNELANGDIVFVATGITDGVLARGVSMIDSNKCSTETIIMTAKDRLVRRIISSAY